jgi:cell division protein ZapA
MSTATQTVSIFGREYRVACAPEERDALLACARYVDEKMGSIRAGGRTLGADRIAVLTALQITQELFAARNGEGVSAAELKRRVRELHALADDALTPQEKLFT